MELLLVFTLANVVNVIIQTAKSLCTVKCGKVSAAIVNAVAYGFYTYILILMSADLPLLQKCFIVGGCNFVGVFFVKLIEEKIKKEKLWLVKATVKNSQAEKMAQQLQEKGISNSTIELKEYTVFDCYCSTKAETKTVTEICRNVHGKLFATEATFALRG